MGGEESSEQPLAENAFRRLVGGMLGLGTIKLAAGPVRRVNPSTALGTLKGDDLQRRSDPRPFSLSVNLASRAVILYVVAVHAKAPWKPVIWTTPCRSLQLERNAGGGHRQ